VLYERTAVLGSTAERGAAGAHLWRSKAPKYATAYVSANNVTHNNLSFEHTSGLNAALLEQLFAAWTRVASNLRVELGHLHLLIKRGATSEEYNYGAFGNLKQIRAYGLRSLAARNWFGPDLTGIIGRDRLLSLPHATATAWGGVQLDLVRDPWTADFEALVAEQARLISIFNSWGFMGNYGGVVDKLPGPSWTPRTWGLR
jgi:hypothetical protein